MKGTRKEVRPVEETRACEICGRTILKGERPEPYLAPGGRRHLVCELCAPRAEHEGWIRESAHAEVPTAARARPAPRRSLLGRLRRSREARPGDGARPEGGHPEESAARHDGPEAGERAPYRRDARHVRAVPTTAEVKIERGLELFNESEHTRTIAGIARTLGPPFVMAAPVAEVPSAVEVVVAWELSWYRYRIDLGDEREPVSLVEKGEELGQLDDGLKSWNASADGDGRLSADVGSPG